LTEAERKKFPERKIFAEKDTSTRKAGSWSRKEKTASLPEATWFLIRSKNPKNSSPLLVEGS